MKDDHMDSIDLTILDRLQESFPVCSRPFLELGQQCGLSEEEMIERIASLQREGLIRRIGPILDLRKLGRKGVLAALRISEDEAAAASEIINAYPEISHNYLRPNETGYNLWFTVSAKEARIEEVLLDIREKVKAPMIVLPTRRIFKIGVKFDIL
jgi:DNA-binding Lrp family transcriptional regulator